MSVRCASINFQIRSMRLADIKQVTAIDQLSFSLPWPDNSYRYELGDNPTSLLWVAEVDTPDGETKVCGMVVVWLVLDETHIATLAVHPDYRRMGIGKRLLSAALSESVQHGACMATLEVRAGNIAAQNIYHHFGFEIVGKRHRYYKDNQEDAILMTLRNLLDLTGID